MMDKYMKKYREQMDKVTLSDATDQMILDDLLKADAKKVVQYRVPSKRRISAAMVAATIIIASFVIGCTGIAIHRAIIKSNKAESQEDRFGVTVDVGESYYYDLLAGDAGEIYVLTDNDFDAALTDHHAIVWKSVDHGDIWEEILSQPNDLSEENYLYAGDLREGEAGIEAIVIMEERNDEEKDGYINRVYQITANSYVKYDMDEVYALLGGHEHLWNVKYVNDHTIALAGVKECLLYDTNTQKVVKNLPYDLTMGFLKTQDQFLLYGKEIYQCLNAETLEEQEPEEGLKEFVQMMFEKNNREVLPPMAVWNDTVVCVTKAGIYEYKDGEIILARRLSNTVNDGHSFNGLLPFCKIRDGEYYVCTFSGTGMSLWLIDDSKEEMKNSGCSQQSSNSESLSKMIGEHMKFGSYQGEEIEWRVIDADDENGRVLLLSEYGLDAKPYNEDSSTDIKWEDCTLRQWLNDEFYESAFTDEEQEKIILSTSEGFPQYNSRVPGKDYDYLERETEDYVFLLSYTEVYQYIGDTHGSESDPARICYPTEYTENNTDVKIYNDACGWWLCAGNSGYNGSKHRPFVVSVHGGISLEENVNSGKYAVRPAMWIELK